MELNLIEIDPELAKAAYQEYADAVRANHDAEDQAIAEGYKALSEGKRLVNLPATLAAGGTTTVEGKVGWRNTPVAVTVPRLAAVRANAKIAFTSGVDRDGGCLITSDKKAQELHQRNTKDRFPIQDGTFEKVENDRWSYVRAIVPSIPPRLRPKRGLRLYTILWEAEWALDPVPPVDPALLRQLGGDLYVLCGTWDLTDLERSVLSGRL